MPSTFRMQGVNFFLTFPKCRTPKEEVKENILSIFKGEVEWLVVAEEKHQDGDPHLHILIRFLQKKIFNGKLGMKKLDSIVKSTIQPEGQHGNYQLSRNVRNTLNYVTKERQFLEYGINVSEMIKNPSKSTKSMQVAKAVMEGSTLTQIMESDPGFAMMNLKKIKEFQTEVRIQRTLKTFQQYVILGFKVKPEMTLEEPSQMMIDACLKLEAWCNTNLKTGTVRSPRQKQLWLYGPPCIGKSRFMSKMESYMYTFAIPKDENFLDEWYDDVYSLATLDEYFGQKTIAWLNAWLDGSTCMLRKKGSQYRKCHNIATIISSNDSPHKVYEKAIKEGTCSGRIEALCGDNGRLEVVFMPDPFIVEVSFTSLPNDILENSQKEQDDEEVVQLPPLNLSRVDTADREIVIGDDSEEDEENIMDSGHSVPSDTESEIRLLPKRKRRDSIEDLD